MKKFWYISVSILCLIFILSVSAIGAETTFSGSYRVRSHSEYNIDKEVRDIFATISHDKPLTSSWFEQRFRLTITHTRSEYLKAVIRMDLVEDTWGQGQAFLMNAGGSDYIDLAYIEFTVPAVGTFTAGLFDEEYGHGLTISRGRASSSFYGFSGVRWRNAWGPVAVSTMYAKELEIDTIFPAIVGLSGKDADLWTLDVKITPVENHTLELYGGLYKEEFGFPFLIFGIPTIYTTQSFLTGFIKGPSVFSWAVPRDSTVGFMGVAYSGALFDIIEIRGEYTHFFGKGDFYYNRLINPYIIGLPAAGTPPRSVNLRGYNLYLDVSFNMDLFRVGVAFLMGSGQDHIWNAYSHDRININGLPFNDGLSWATILVPGDLGGLNTRSPFINGTENLTSIKLYFEVFPMKNFSINGAVVWAKWTKPVGSPVGIGGYTATARGAYLNSKGSGYVHPMTFIGNHVYEPWNVSTDLGWEFDLGFSWQILDGLTFSCDAGVLLTGGSFDYARWTGTEFVREEWGPIWRVVNTLNYEF